MTTISQRERYLDYLAESVSYNNGKTVQARTKHPQKWRNIVDSEKADINSDNCWVWSDQHFGHSNIIKFSSRPFDSVSEMDEILISNYNSVVSHRDACFWVGDASFYGTTKTTEIIRRCNGYKILIVGNHDFDKKVLRSMGFDEVHVLYELTIDNVDIIMTHYPFTVDYPTINIHGHEHIRKTPTQFSERLGHINVCCEYHQYIPLNLKDVVRTAKTRIDSFEKGDKW